MLKKSYICFEVACLYVCCCCTNCLKYINGVYNIFGGYFRVTVLRLGRHSTGSGVHYNNIITVVSMPN